MHLCLTARSLDWLAEHRIFFHVKGGSRLRVGDTLIFADYCEVEPYVGIYGGYAVCPLGFMSFSHSPLSPKLRVGRYCSIAHDVDAHLVDHPLDRLSTSPFCQGAESHLIRTFADEHDGWNVLPDEMSRFTPPVIEHDVWIGAHVSILPGVRIATGAVVGAGSVVTRSVGPYEIVAGNPARLIRKRFDDDLIGLLLESEWWRYRLSDFDGLDVTEPRAFAEAVLRRRGGLQPYQPPPARLSEMPV
jgi:acetyltransferase-like isoleucine patch superfamily enzyme